MLPALVACLLVADKRRRHGRWQRTGSPLDDGARNKAVLGGEAGDDIARSGMAEDEGLDGRPVGHTMHRGWELEAWRRKLLRRAGAAGAAMFLLLPAPVGRQLQAQGSNVRPSKHTTAQCKAQQPPDVQALKQLQAVLPQPPRVHRLPPVLPTAAGGAMETRGSGRLLCQQEAQPRCNCSAAAQVRWGCCGGAGGQLPT